MDRYQREGIQVSTWKTDVCMYVCILLAEIGHFSAKKNVKSRENFLCPFYFLKIFTFSLLFNFFDATALNNF